MRRSRSAVHDRLILVVPAGYVAPFGASPVIFAGSAGGAAGAYVNAAMADHGPVELPAPRARTDQTYEPGEERL